MVKSHSGDGRKVGSNKPPRVTKRSKSGADLCPMRDILDRVGDRWSLLVLFHLADGTRRFGELKADIGDISSRVLTETVRHLEQDGLVSRRVYSSIPPKVEYTLTTLGRSLTKKMLPLVAWAESSRRQIAKARQVYNTRVTAEQ